MKNFKANIDRELHTPVHRGAVESEPDYRCYCYYCGYLLTDADDIINEGRLVAHRSCHETETDNGAPLRGVPLVSIGPSGIGGEYQKEI